MVVIAIVVGLIVYFLTKRSVEQKTIVSEDRSQNLVIGPVPVDNRSLYESVGLDTSTGEDVELQPSPAYQAMPDYMPEYL